MNTYYSFPLKSAWFIIILLLMGLACNFSSTTVDHEGTAQALQATEQALDAKLTQAVAASIATRPAERSSSEKAPTATQTATATSNGNVQATTTAQALHVLQTANAQNKQATADAYANQQNQAQLPANSPTVVFEVINDSVYTICRIYFSSPQSDEWLMEDAIDVNIPPDYQQSFNVQSAAYDLRVDDCSGFSIEEYYEIQIPAYHTWVVTGDEPLCGDGYCGDFEHAGNCPQDCGSANSVCGDGYCDWDEDMYSCSADCGYCGDDYCGDFENAGNCPQDCGDYDGPLCGDGYCGDFENPGNCPQDCP